MTRTRTRTRRRLWRWTIAAAVLAAFSGIVVVVVVMALPSGPSRSPGCTVTVAGASYDLDLAQAANAATIAAVARGRGLSDHAVTVALATGMQESKLHNVPYGDRDSLGLFQQRPSQGWGTRVQLLDPHYAAAEFFTHLARVPGWDGLPVADAAQAVQRSADGSAYADWEPAARAVAQALTGEAPHAIACYYDTPTSSASGLTTALTRDVGPNTIGVPVSARTGWRTASWLVAQAAQYSLDTVTYDRQRWTRKSGRWRADPAAGPVVRYSLLPARR